MTDDHVADRKERLDHTRAVADREQESALREPEAAEHNVDADEPETLRIVRAI